MARHDRPGSLYRRLLAALTAQGIALPNPASVRLHERLGFVATGTIPRAGRKFDRWHDLGFWHLGLQASDHTPSELLTPRAAFLATQRA